MKLKTRKSVQKRVKISGGKLKKVIIRAGGQDHFNARESGKVTKNKRRDKILSSANRAHIAKTLPYR